MSTYDWSKFSLRVTINAGTQEIYDSWATQENLEKWFLRKAEFKKSDGSVRDRNSRAEEDDSYTWLWHGWPDDVVENGKILEANGKDRIKFLFTDESTVTVTTKVEEGIGIVELLQENIKDDEKSKVNIHLGCSTGWTFYLANLKSLLEGGIDLRNKDIKIKSVINS